MKIALCFILLSTLAACQANVIPEDSAVVPDSAAVSESARNGNLNKYYLYTRNNREVPTQISASANSIANADILYDRDIVLLIHGHNGGPFNSLNPLVKDSFLEHHDVNVIVVDWESYAMQYYSSAVGSVPSIGDGVANFLRLLINNGQAELSRIHLVGFDLGAHVAGFAGRYIGGQVARITGLDPSASRWGANSGRLNENDARFVEVIHTDTLGLGANGIRDSIGTMDFYPNGGNNQPGCSFNSCSHDRAWELFAASLVYNHFLARQCTTSSQITWNSCNGQIRYMGNNEMTKLGSGMYRLSTERRFPF